MVWYCKVWYGIVWYVIVRFDMVWYCIIWYCKVWYGIARYSMELYGTGIDTVKFTKPLIMQFSSVSCYLHRLGPTYLSLHPILEHLQPVFFA
jgi:hypothetical protein